MLLRLDNDSLSNITALAPFSCTAIMVLGEMFNYIFSLFIYDL